MNNDRYPEFVEIIAAPGRGKSTDLEKVINSKANERFLVIIPDTSEPLWHKYPLINGDDIEEEFNPDFEGVLCVEQEEKLTFPYLYKLFKEEKLKGLNLILDDPVYAEEYCEKELVRILKRKRQYDIDIFSTSHSYDEVPPKFFSFITIYSLGYTEGELNNRRGNLGSSYSKHLEHHNEVNRLAGIDKSKPEYYLRRAFRKNGDLI
jgi:hypothetical protein